MNGDDYRDLAALWSDAAPADDEREVERLARQTPRRARMAQWAELVVVVLLCGSISVSFIWRMGPGTVLTGSLLLVLLGWSAWKRHRLTNMALLIDERDRLSFVRSSVQAKEAELSRSALGLGLILPGIVIGTLWGYSLRHPQGETDLGTFLVAVLTAPRGLVILGCVLCAVFILSSSHRRVRGELTQLRQLQRDYVEEARRDDCAGG